MDAAVKTGATSAAELTDKELDNIASSAGRALNQTCVVVTYTPGGEILHANFQFLRLFGCKLSDIVGQSASRFISQPKQRTHLADLWTRLAAGQPIKETGLWIGVGGQEVWLDSRFVPVVGTNGHTESVVQIAEDVTARLARESEEQGQIAAIQNTHAVAHFSLEGRVIWVNDLFLQATGYQRSEVLDGPHAMFMDAHERESDEYRAFWQSLRTGQSQAGEFRRIRQDGSDLWLHAVYTPILDPAGRPTKVVKYATDITEEKLRQADYQSQVTAIHKSNCVVTFDMTGGILDANDLFLEETGYTLGEIRGCHHRIFVEPAYSHSSDYASFWHDLRRGRHHSGLYKRVAKDGTEIWLQATYNPIRDMNGRVFKVVKYATDVTLEKLRQADYQGQIEAINKSQDVIVFALDGTIIDINDRFLDTLGYERNEIMGQHHSMLVEREYAATTDYIDFWKKLKSGQHHAGLYKRLGKGGKEVWIQASYNPILDLNGRPCKVVKYAIDVSANVALAEAFEEAQRQTHLDSATSLPNRNKLTAFLNTHLADSAGSMAVLYLYLDLFGEINDTFGYRAGDRILGEVAPGDGSTPDDLLRAADVALSSAKQSGRGRHAYFADEINAKLHGQRKLIEDMRNSFTAGDFYLEYQPRFEVQDRSIRSVEALLRWFHPERGRISPVEFIPLAELCGLIVPMGEWILQTACHAAVRWGGIGVSVNLSPIQFSDDDLVRKVSHALEVSKLPAHLLELEVTEGVLVNDSRRALDVLNALKAIGVKLAIDDFGTGYSSLSYLRNFPFDVIKIDRSFVRDLDAPNSSRPIIQAILALGRALGLSITAEGVETNEQFNLLAEDGCDEIQGFLLAMPSPADEIDKMMARRAQQAPHAGTKHLAGETVPA